MAKISINNGKSYLTSDELSKLDVKTNKAIVDAMEFNAWWDLRCQGYVGNDMVVEYCNQYMSDIVVG